MKRFALTIATVTLGGLTVIGCDRDETASTSTSGSRTTTTSTAPAVDVDVDVDDGKFDFDPPRPPCGFFCPPDGGDEFFECDLFAQDCPAGEKCMPWANDGTEVWNAIPKWPRSWPTDGHHWLNTRIRMPANAAANATSAQPATMRRAILSLGEMAFMLS